MNIALHKKEVGGVRDRGSKLGRAALSSWLCRLLAQRSSEHAEPLGASVSSKNVLVLFPDDIKGMFKKYL